MKKVIHPCDIKIGQKYAPVFVEIEFENGNLSLHGVVGPTIGGNARGSAGQIQAELKDRSRRVAPGWNRKMIDRLYNTWERWHLNDLRAECAHQRARGEKWSTHPSAVCPDCGYRLGSAWLKENVPADVINWLFSLPNTDRQPNWV